MTVIVESSPACQYPTVHQVEDLQWVAEYMVHRKLTRKEVIAAADRLLDFPGDMPWQDAMEDAVLYATR